MYTDIFITVLLLWSLYNGWRNGFLKEIVSSAGFLLGLLVAAVFYSQLGEHLTVSGSQGNQLSSLVAFFILWILVPIALGFAANLLTKALKEMHLGLPNSLLGAVVSVLKYLILLSCVLNVMSALHILDEQKRASSRLYAPVTGLLHTLFPTPSDTAAGETDDEAGASATDTLWVDFSDRKASHE